MTKEFQAITTQAEFDAMIGERLNRQKETYEEKLKGLESLQTELTNLKEELQAKNQLIEESKNTVATKEQEFNDLNTQLESLKLEKLKQSIAIKNGLPFELAARLQGDDEETILEDAKSLQGFISVQGQSQPLKDVEPAQLNSDDTEYVKMLENLNL